MHYVYKKKEFGIILDAFLVDYCLTIRFLCPHYWGVETSSNIKYN